MITQNRNKLNEVGLNAKITNWIIICLLFFSLLFFIDNKCKNVTPLVLIVKVIAVEVPIFVYIFLVISLSTNLCCANQLSKEGKNYVEQKNLTMSPI